MDDNPHRGSLIDGVHKFITLLERVVNKYFDKKSGIYTSFVLYKKKYTDEHSGVMLRKIYKDHKKSILSNDDSWLLSESIKITSETVGTISLSAIYTKTKKNGDNKLAKEIFQAFVDVCEKTTLLEKCESESPHISEETPALSDTDKSTSSSSDSSEEEEVYPIKDMLTQAFISIKPQLSSTIDNMGKIPEGVIYGNAAKRKLEEQIESLRGGIKTFESNID
jgi:hypothetical protein